MAKRPTTTTRTPRKSETSARQSKPRSERIPLSLFPERNVALLVAGRALAMDPLLTAATFMRLHEACAKRDRRIRCMPPDFLPPQNMLAYEDLVKQPARSVHITSSVMIGVELELVVGRSERPRDGFDYGEPSLQVGRLWRVEQLRDALDASRGILDDELWLELEGIVRSADLDPIWLSADNRLLVAACGVCQASVTYGALNETVGSYSWFEDDDGRSWNGNLPMGPSVAKVCLGAAPVELDVSPRAHAARDRGYRARCRELEGSEAARYMVPDAGGYCLYVARLGT